jgi:hypothetical protein
VICGEIYCAEGAFRAGLFAHYCRMDGSLYPVRKWLMTTCPHLVIALFHGCGRVFPFFLFVFFLYPFYEVLWRICFGVLNFLSASFAASYVVSFPGDVILVDA